MDKETKAIFGLTSRQKSAVRYLKKALAVCKEEGLSLVLYSENDFLMALFYDPEKVFVGSDENPNAQKINLETLMAADMNIADGSISHTILEQGKGILADIDISELCLTERKS